MQLGKFLQAAPGAGDQFFTLLDVVGVEELLGERTFDSDWLERRVNDELRQHGVTAYVPFEGQRELQGSDFSQDIPQVEIAHDQAGDILATDFAEVSRFTLHAEF